MSNTFYQTGGSLPANSPSYIPREADTQLYNYLKESKYCYVLNARQIGKSSLRVRTSKQLEDEGYKCVNIDITAIGSENIEVKEWYFSLVLEIVEQLELDIDALIEYWDTLENITIIHRFSKIIDRVLDDCHENIIIFLDEIDSILGIDIFSADDFFAVIRTFYNLRSEEAKYNRLSFAIFGVATAEDLMRDSSRTPFNIAHSIKLTQLSLKESMPLTNGLNNQSIQPKQILEKVFEYTSGTPYLTQKILAKIASNPIDDLNDIDSIVDKLFIQKGFEETNISHIQNRILFDERYNIKMLNLIAQMLSGNVEANNSDLTQIYLKLSGLIKSENGVLVYNNKIYEMLFDKEWAETQLAKFDRFITKDLNRWLELNRDKSALLQGEVLKEAIKWAEGRDDLSNNESEFLRLSIQEEQELQIKEEKKKFQSKLIKILLVVFVFISYLSYTLYNNNLTIEKINKNLNNMNEKLIIAEQKNYDLTLDKTSKIINYSFGKQKKQLEELVKKDTNNSTITSDENDYNKIESNTSSYIASIKNRPTPKIDNNGTIQHNKVSFYISIELQKKYPELIKLILQAESMENDERQYWFDIMPSMKDGQIDRLYAILDTEKLKLEALDRKYQNEISTLNEKTLIEITRKAFKHYDENIKKEIEDNNLTKIFIIAKDTIKAIVKVDDFIKMKNEVEKIKNSHLLEEHYFYLQYLLYQTIDDTDKAWEYINKSYVLSSKKDYFNEEFEKFGNSFFNQNKYDKAIKAYQKAIEINPKNDDAYNNMGYAYYVQKEYTQAIKAFQKAIEINPKNEWAYTNLFELWMILNQPFEATLQAHYVALFETNKEIFIKYEMLKILQSIRTNQTYSLSIPKWQEKYQGIGLGSWEWSEIEGWIKAMEQSDTQSKLLKAVEVFRGHQKANAQN